ncbi:hypothetical protein Bca52824_070633 [Brassica carinata]|uniref:Remorin C-terminal domain-containing protein n=1 Tax=Brassica carinata TaxID=52824 RepID=A0A8X7Q4B9_BRACI|nr:hypothetical protein Bca52824_070633 [Brassica carinata]
MEDNPALNWLKNQAYWYEKNDYYDEKESEFAASVAAAAFVITSMEEAYKEHAKRMREETKRSRKKKTNSVILKTEVKRINRSYTHDLTIGGESFIKQKMDNTPQENRRAQEIDSSSRTLGLASVSSKADSWEKTQLNKIRLRYEKMKAEIVGWENERKSAAKLKMEKIKSELQKRTEINNQHYKAKLARIQVIADGAKKQLEEKKRSQEAQVQEKVKKMRRTGKAPANYFCFRCY